MNRARGRGRGGRSAVFDQTSGKSGVHPQMLKQARASGQLNLSNRGLSDVPDSVWRVNIDVPEESREVSLDNTEDRWWEQVDLTKLILASNALRHLSDDIKLLPALTVLDVHDNSISDLPESLAELVNIQRLNISHNKLTTMPKCVFSLTSMSVLLASHNQITVIDEDIRLLNSLEHLELSNNQLKSLPKGIGYLSKVTKLDISNNLLTELPAEMGDLGRLQHFDATSNQLCNLPETFGNLMYLSTLNLRHNKIKQIPSLKLCKDLKELYIGNNQIDEIDGSLLECLYSLVVFDVRDNKISSIPDEITVLANLERLDVTNNNLSALPYPMGTMNKLKFIVLDGNPMKSIRRDIIQRGTIELKKYLRSRMTDDDKVAAVSSVKTTANSGIIGQQQSTVDPFAVATTKKLDYSNKKATVIPDDIWQIISEKEVQTIDFSKNQLNEWPVNLMIGVDHLKDLSLGFNKLTALSSDVGLFLKMTYLDLRNNMLSDLPDISGLQLLQCVILSYNRFKKIPEVLYELKKLENITISDNQISDLDVDGLGRLPVLSVLDVQNNNISQVPPQLGNLTQLRALQLEGNAFKIPRPAILAKGTIAVLDWLRDRIPS